MSPDNLVPILKCGVRTQLQTRPTCVFQRIYEKLSTNEIFPMDLRKSLKDLFEMIHLSTDSCKWPGAPSRGVLDSSAIWKLYSLNQPPLFLFQLVLHVCRGYGWVRVLVKLKNSQLVDTQRIAGVQLELFEFDFYV